MKKILVTGAQGFIGSHVCDVLRERGYHVMVFDRKHEFEKANPDDTFILGDTRDKAAVHEAVALSEGVIHLAGVLGTQETINEPQPAVETNIIGGLNVFQAVRHYKVPAVYIAVGNHWMNNSYSISKTTAERFALMFNKEHGTKIAVVRGLNAYGPRQKAYPVRKIMPNFIKPALKGEAITVYGDGSQIMDMIYVRDLADILVRALTVDHGVYDRCFEAGSGRRTSVQEIAQEVIKQVGSGSINNVPMRPGEPERSIVLGNPETLYPLFVTNQQEAWTPSLLTSLEDGVAATIQWFREND